VDFKNTVIIMTSNLGTADLRRKAIGFATDGADVGYQQIKDKVTEALKRSFRPEFLNRIDEVIVFHELTMAEVGQIVDLMMARVLRQLESQDLELILTDQAKEVLATRGYDPQLGARPLRRAIQRLLEDPLSEKVLFHEFAAGVTILVDVDEDGSGLTFTAVSAPDQPPVELAESQES